MHRIITSRTAVPEVPGPVMVGTKRDRTVHVTKTNQALRPDRNVLKRIQLAEAEIIGGLLETAAFFARLALWGVPVVTVLGVLILPVVLNGRRQEGHRLREELQRDQQKSQAGYRALQRQCQNHQALQQEFSDYRQKCTDLLWNMYGPPGRGYEFFCWFSKHFSDAQYWKDHCTITPNVMVRRFIHDDDPTLPEEPDEDRIETLRPEPELQPNALEGHPVFDPIKRQKEALRKLLTPEP